MVSKEQVVELVNDRVRQVLLVAEAALPPSQFQAFRTVVLNHFGRNGLVGDLDYLDGKVGLQGRDGQGRNTPCTKGGGP
jgi:hypothetical protein